MQTGAGPVADAVVTVNGLTVRTDHVGTAIVPVALTDNRNRTSGEVRKIFERGGGKMGSSGNVSFLFDRKGLFAVSTEAIDEDTLMECSLEAGPCSKLSRTW